jgi:hypothetical protein
VRALAYVLLAESSASSAMKNNGKTRTQTANEIFYLTTDGNNLEDNSAPRSQLAV